MEINKIINDDCFEVLKFYPDNFFDAIITEKIIKRIDKALLKMEEKGCQNHVSYQRLSEKKALILSGCSFTLVDVTEEVIGSCGKLFAQISRNYKH